MRGFVSFAGLVAGIAAAIALLLNNPMKPSQVAITSPEEAYVWQALELHGATLGPAKLLNVPGDRYAGELPDETVRGANAAVLIVRDAAGQPAALAVRIEYQDKQPDLLRSAVGVSSHLNIIWPNYGSLLLHAEENRWTLIRGQVLELLGLQLPNPERPFSVTTLNGARDVIGGSGAFAGVGGSYNEELMIDAEAAGRYTGRLALGLREVSAR